MTGEKKKTAAAVLTGIARDRYEFGRSTSGEPFALPTFGPKVVRMLRGHGSLRAELSAAFLEEQGHPPTAQALVDALTALEGIALAAEPVDLALRVAERDGALWIDLGDESGDVIRLDGTGWDIRSESPVLHRRTALTAPMVRPAARGDLSRLWELVNVAEVDRPVLLAFLVAAWMPSIPHPILLLTGEQGTGKSTASRILAGLVDPSTVPLRKPPRDLDSWTTAALGSHVVAVDNLSDLPIWLSDALCRASTGDGDVKRKLYSDADVFVFAFRRVVLLNGIDLGAVRDDLADRLVTVDLRRITEAQRRPDADLSARLEEALPVILAGLLDLAVRVLDVLPRVDLDRLPRMADFGRVLAAVDTVMGSQGMARYREQAGELAADAVTSDPVLALLASTVRTRWSGAAADLLDVLDDARPEGQRPPKGWPAGARALAVQLKRRAPSLRRLGWTVEQTTERTKRGAVWLLDPPNSGDERGDEGGDETVTKPVTEISSPRSSPVSSPPETALQSGKVEIGDEVTNEPPNSLLSTRRKEEEEPAVDVDRSCPDSPSLRHPDTPTPSSPARTGPRAPLPTDDAGRPLPCPECGLRPHHRVGCTWGLATERAAS